MGKSKIECKKLDALKGDQKCVFCHQTDIDEMKYGPIYMHKNIITHYYCLLLSSNMEQNGRDCDGILGFLPNDIHKEVRRGVRLYCTFCKSGGATLGCAIAKCKVVFHLPCGMKHGTLHQFFGEFKSFCAKHRPVQRISAKILSEASKNAMCGICYEKVVPRPIHETLWAPCCQKSAFFHRECVQQLATSAGYFFKCPLCNNTSTFQKEMKEFGIYIPEQDASWECVPNAYQDLLVRHDTCDCATCSCPTGRKTNNQGTRWELILCKFCGSQGIHIGCGRLKWKSPEFVCDTCSGNNEREEEANTRNYHGNRHRLTGPGRTAEIHPSVSADRERERSDDYSSDESIKATLTNRGGRRRVISPPPRVSTPPLDTKTHVKSEKHRKRSDSASAIKEEKAPVLDTVTYVIEDSDDDIEVVSETNGSCLKTNDGSTIPIIQVKDSVKKRLNVEGDVNVVPDEIVDITIQMEGPPKKKTPSPHVEEVIYNFPSLTPKPSTSTSYCPPSTSFNPPPDVTKFVLVDPSTFRPEDLPPGTVLYRSFTPMVPMPQTSAPSQPQVQPAPTSQVPMPQLGRAGGRGADAKHPDLSEHRGWSSFHLHAPARNTKKTSRSNKHNSFGRRRRGRCDHDRLNPQVLVSPLKCRISNDGFFEILLPRRNLGFGFGHGSFKRKASPLPSRPAKKIKVSSNDSIVKKNKAKLKKGSPDKLNKSSNSKKKTTKSRVRRNYESKKIKHPQASHILQKGTEEKIDTNGTTQITMFFSSNKKSDGIKKKKKSAPEKKNCCAGKENTSPEQIVKKTQTVKKSPLMEWKYKKIDEYLSKIKSEPIKQSNDCENAKLSNVEEESSKTVVSTLDELIGCVVEKCLSDTLPTAGIITNSDASPLDIKNETNFSVQSNFSISETTNIQLNTSSDENISKTTSSFLKNNSLMRTESADTFKEHQVCEVNHKDSTCNIVFPHSDLINVEKTVGKTNNIVMNTKTYELPTASSITDSDASSLDIKNETNFSVQSISSLSETANKQLNKSSDENHGSSPDICKTTSSFLEIDSLMMTESADTLKEDQVCEVNYKDSTCNIVFPHSDLIIVEKAVDKTNNIVMNTKTYKFPTAGSITDSDASSLDIKNETNFSVQSNSSLSETANKQLNTSSDRNHGSSPDICKTTSSFLKNNSLMMTESADMFKEDQVCEVNYKNSTCNSDPHGDFINLEKTVEKINNIVMNTKTESDMFVSHQIEISDGDVNCETNNNKDISSASHERTPEILKDSSSHIKPPYQLTQSLSHCEYSEGNQTKEISSAHVESFSSAGEIHSFSIKRVEKLDVDKNVNEPQITSNLCKEKNTRTARSLFPKIKMKVSKVKCHAKNTNNVLKSAQWVKQSKVMAKSESERIGEDLQKPITKKRKIENVNSEDKSESNTEAIENSKTKANVKEIRSLKTKRRKIEKNGPICKIGAIDKYFSPITRDYSSSPNKTFGNMTSESKDPGENKAKNSIKPPPTKLENNRFWKMLNAQNSP